jgi:hypothetical protein
MSHVLNKQDLYALMGDYATYLESKITELERHIRGIAKPQFWMFKNGTYNPASYCCNHCDFSSTKFAERDEHAESCAGREEYLRGSNENEYTRF